jgi:CheY-like chemotaxis protein
MYVEMPGMKGPEVVTKLREWENVNLPKEKGARVKILMISMAYDGNRVASSFAGGCDEYMTKFITVDNLKSIMQELGLVKL